MDELWIRGSLQHSYGFLKADRRCCLQIDMPPQNVLYYVPAQRAWVKSEVEELIEVSFLCLPALYIQLSQLCISRDPETLSLTINKPAFLASQHTTHPVLSCSCLTCLVSLL